MIGAVILAAGVSRRMGRSKLTLPWHASRSIIEHVVDVFHDGGAQPIVVVVGAEDADLANLLTGQDVVQVAVPAGGEMLSSVRAGLSSLDGTDVEAALLAPGDHPLLDPATVSRLIAAWKGRRAPIIAPSIDGRRGHPVLVGRPIWPAILNLEADLSLRDFLDNRGDEIEYVVVADRGVIRDVDTPRDYTEALAETDRAGGSDEVNR